MVKDTKKKGGNLELDFKKIFQEHGYHVTKAGGSFGIDLVGMKYNHKNILVNVKWIRNYCGPKERKELLDTANKLDAIPILAYKSKQRYGKRTIEVLKDVKTKGEALVVDGSKYDLENFLLSRPERMMRELWQKKQNVVLEKEQLDSHEHVVPDWRLSEKKKKKNSLPRIRDVFSPPYHSEEETKKLHFYNPQEK